MGLDNGIIIKNLPKEDYKYFTNIIDKITTEKDEVEICYWRKCYNIRHIFLSTFNYSNKFIFSVSSYTKYIIFF